MRKDDSTYVGLFIILVILMLLVLVSSYFLTNEENIDLSSSDLHSYQLEYVGGIYGAGPPYYLDGIQELKIHNDYLFVSSFYDRSFTILDINNRSNPEYVGNIVLDSFPRKFSISKDGDWIFLGTEKRDNIGEGKLYILNISNKKNPTIAGELVIDSNGSLMGCSYVETKNVNYVIGGSENRLYSIDVSNKNNPFIISFIEVGESPHGIWANETVAFVLGHFDSKVYTIDVSDPHNMSHLDNYSSSLLYRTSQLYGNFAPNIYVTSLYSSIAIFDISNPESIKSIVFNDSVLQGVCSVVPSSDETFMFASIARTESRNGYLLAIDITTKSDPILVSFVENNESVPLSVPASGALDFAGNYIYVGLLDDDGVSVFKFD